MLKYSASSHKETVRALNRFCPLDSDPDQGRMEHHKIGIDGGRPDADGLLDRGPDHHVRRYFTTRPCYECGIPKAVF